MAWAGPYVMDWVYTNGTIKVRDMLGLRLPGYYNISKIKKYECLVQVKGLEERYTLEKGEESSKNEADLNQLFHEEAGGDHFRV